MEMVTNSLQEFNAQLRVLSGLMDRFVTNPPTVDQAFCEQLTSEVHAIIEAALSGIPKVPKDLLELDEQGFPARKPATEELQIIMSVVRLSQQIEILVAYLSSLAHVQSLDLGDSLQSIEYWFQREDWYEKAAWANVSSDLVGTV